MRSHLKDCLPLLVLVACACVALGYIIALVVERL